MKVTFNLLNAHFSLLMVSPFSRMYSKVYSEPDIILFNRTNMNYDVIMNINEY